MVYFLQYLVRNMVEFVDGFNYMYWNMDGVCLICDRVGDCLMDLLGCVGGEFVIMVVFEFINCFYQIDVVFLNQVKEL